MTDLRSYSPDHTDLHDLHDLHDLPDKDELRRAIAARRAAISPDARPAMERAILEKIMALPAWRSAPLILGYAPVRGEIDFTPLWQAAIAAGKRYALPCTLTGAALGQMAFRRLDVYDPAALRPARYHIPEPTEACPLLSPEDMEGAVILVPGLSFDADGFRIGYGGGYYDRFLADLSARGIRVTTVGAVFSACRTPSLPHEPHDVPVDIVLDELPRKEDHP